MLRVEALSAYAKVQAFLASKPTLPPALRELPWIGPWAQHMLEQLSADPTAIKRTVPADAGAVVRRGVALIGGVGRNVAKLFFAVLSMFFLLRDGPRLVREARAVLEGILGPRVHDYPRRDRRDDAGRGVRADPRRDRARLCRRHRLLSSRVEAPVLMGAIDGADRADSVRRAAGVGQPGVVDARHRQPLGPASACCCGACCWSAGWTTSSGRLVISNATRMPFLLVVFGVLGGVLAFGLVGLFIGPVLLAVSLAIWREWMEEHQQPPAVPGTQAR